MKKYILIAKHELITSVKRKEFIWMTIGLPLFMLSVVALPIIFMGSNLKEEIKIGYVDKTGTFQPDGFIKYPDEASAKKDLFEGKITHFFIIPEDYLSTGNVSIYSTKRLSSSGSMDVEKQIKDFLMGNLLKGQPEKLIERVKDPIHSDYFTVQENKESREGFGAFLIPIGFGVIFMLSIFASSGFLLQGVVEEKENRVMEILLSSVSHRDLLIGKILGLGAVGLVQLFIWFMLGIAILSSVPAVVLDFMGSLHISLLMAVLAPIYFILGYLVFASIMAGLGAIATTSREGQQLAAVFSLSAAIPMIFVQAIISNPDAVFARALSLFPLTSSLTMIMRLSINNVPIYDIVLSLMILIASVFGVIEMSVRIFRASLLMYGKKPTLIEVIRYVR